MNLTENSKSLETKQIKSIAKVENGVSAEVVDIRSGDDVVEKLETMGIRPGVTIKKVSTSLFHGPIVLEIDFMQIALGYDMAKQIFVKV